MAATFSGDDLLITLESGVTTIDVLDLYKQWKQWILNSGNMRFPPAFRSDGGNPLSSVINQGSYIFLNNTAGWRIKPPEEDITIYFTGNLAVEDTSLPAFRTTIGAFTAAILGLQPVTQGVTPVMGAQLAIASFEGGVTIDVDNGLAGTEYPVGTPGTPVNNLTDAYTIATNRGLTHIYVNGMLTMPGTTFSGYHIEGMKAAFITVSGIDHARFHDCQVSGSVGRDNRFMDCALGNLTATDGYIHLMHCGIMGPLYLDNCTAIVQECSSAQSGENETIIDFTNSASGLDARSFTGALKLRNKNGAQPVTIDMAGGQVTIDSTVTNGVITLRGTASSYDNSTGTSLVKTHALMNPINITATTNKMIEGLRPHHSGYGNVWYWDPIDGSDSNDGRTPTTACATFAYIHDNLVVNYNNDVVLALPSDPSGQTTTNENISITKSYVFLRGPGKNFRIQSLNDNLDAINITGNGVQVSKVTIADMLTNIKHAIWSSGDFTDINNVIISNVNKGIEIFGGKHCTVDDCDVQDNLDYGLKVAGASERINIKANHFGDNGGTGIVIDNVGGTDVIIHNENIIHGNGGYGIDITAGTQDVTIHADVNVYQNALGDIHDLGANTYNEQIETINNASAAVWAKAIEGLTAEEMLRVMLAALAGKREGIGTATEKYYGQDGVTPRITLTPDALGNGTPTVDGSA